MSRKGTVKVMVGRNGKTRIQEEYGDTVKMYSQEEWAKELEKRDEDDRKAAEKDTKEQEKKLAAEVKATEKENAKLEKEVKKTEKKK